MKVELENIRIGFSGLTENIYAGVLEENGKKWKHKIDVTGDFIHAAIAKWGGFKEVVQSPEGKRYEITVKEIK